jgi:hypothetical protein
MSEHCERGSDRLKERCRLVRGSELFTTLTSEHNERGGRRVVRFERGGGACRERSERRVRAKPHTSEHSEPGSERYPQRVAKVRASHATATNESEQSVL